MVCAFAHSQKCIIKPDNFQMLPYKYSHHVKNNLSSLLTLPTRLVLTFTGLMITTSYQIFFSQTKHLSGQITFGRTNLLHIINGDVIWFAKDNDNFCPYHKYCNHEQ